MDQRNTAKFNLENIAVTVELYDKTNRDPLSDFGERETVRFVICAVITGEVEVTYRNEKLLMHDKEVCLMQDSARNILIKSNNDRSLYWALRIQCEQNELAGSKGYWQLLQKKWKRKNILCEKTEVFSNVGYRCFRGLLLQENKELQLAVYEMILLLLDEDEMMTTGLAAEKVSQGRTDVKRKELILMLLRRSYYRNISLTEMASFLFLSVKQTNYIIRKEFGKTWNILLMEYRVKVALWLIGEEGFSMEAIAECVGYQSVRGLYYAFRKVYSEVPQYYHGKRKLVREMLGTEAEVIERYFRERKEGYS